MHIAICKRIIKVTQLIANSIVSETQRERHTHTHTHTYAHKQTHTYTHIHTHAHTHTRTHTCTHTHTHTHIHVYTHTYMYIHTPIGKSRLFNFHVLFKTILYTSYNKCHTFMYYRLLTTA